MSERTVFNLPVFPPADIFPMMAEAELAELAQDIKDNGLREPIVVAEVERQDAETKKKIKDLMIIDGRNRLRACHIAGVEPEISHLNGKTNLTAYVISANVHRRHMTAGQRAMAVAMIRPDPERGGAKDRGSIATQLGLTSEYVRQARTVLREAPALAQLVLAGSRPLSDAYKEARAKQTAAMSEREQLDSLTARYPDLAQAVIEGQLTLPGALAEAKERDRLETEERSRVVGVLMDAFKVVRLDDETLNKALGWLHDDHEFRDMIQNELAPIGKALTMGSANLAAFLDSASEEIPHV